MGKICDSCTFSSLYSNYNIALKNIETDEFKKLKFLIDNNFYTEFFTTFKSFEDIVIRKNGIILLKAHLKILGTSLKEKIELFIKS
jgi:hypothetical protein